VSEPMVLWSIPHGAAAGNTVRTGVLRHVLERHSSIRVVILSPMAKDPTFTAEIAHPRVTIEDLPPHQPHGVEARLVALMQAGYLDSGISESVRIRKAEALADGTVRWIRPKRLLAQALAPSLVRKESRYALIDRLVSHSRAEALFARYRPSLLVTSSPGLILAEVPLLRTAARRGCFAMAIDPSWDNFTNKLLPVRRVDRLVVWNDIMKQQAIDYHGYDASEIRIAGVAQWDHYFRDSVAISREAFFRRIGADPGKKLVTLTTTPQELYSHHDHVLRVLSRAVRDQRWGVPAQVLVRLHPRDELSHYREFEGVADVILEKPFRQTVRAGDGLAVDVTAESQRHLAATMRYSDVVVNVASTIVIEASIFDAPVVNIAFDGEIGREAAVSARRYYRFTHYQNVTRHNAVRVAWSPAELTQYVGDYLRDPSMDREARRQVVLEQCQFLDGRSAERIAAAIGEELSALTGIPGQDTRAHATCV
jgi:hypothetical protein